MKEAEPLYLWMTYRTLAQGNIWPLPQLAERRNIYWDKRTFRLVNGKIFEDKEVNWLPASVAASAEVQPQAHRVDLPGGQSVLIQPASTVTLPGLPASLRLAVVLDRSYSMASLAGEVSALPGASEPARRARQPGGCVPDGLGIPRRAAQPGGI